MGVFSRRTHSPTTCTTTVKMDVAKNPKGLLRNPNAFGQLDSDTRARQTMQCIQDQGPVREEALESRPRPPFSGGVANCDLQR